MALSLTIGATNQLSFIAHQSMTLKLNTLDLGLVNPSTVPAIGDTVTMGDPTWVGTVVSVTKTDTAERGAHKMVHISATNEDVAGASAAPFNLSDVPNGSTTYGYHNLMTKQVLDREGTTTTEGSCTIYQSGIWPAMTFTLQSTNHGYAGTSFTAQDVTVTWPKIGKPSYQIQFGDPVVTMSVWMNSAMSGTITSTKITDGSVTTPKLAAGAVEADKIAAGAVTAESLTADLILSTLIRTATAGNRVELDPQGIRVYDASETLLLNIPTDDSPIYIAAEVQAANLTVVGAAELQSTTNAMTKNAVLTLQSGYGAPNAAPTVAQGYALGPTWGTPALQPSYRGHGYYDAVGGTSGATPCYVQVGTTGPSDSTVLTVHEWTWATGAVNRTTTLGDTFNSTTPMIASITRIGTSWYVVTRISSALVLYKFTRSTGALVDSTIITSDFTAYDAYSTPISTDGTDVFVPGKAGTNALRICRYNTSLVKQATIALTEPSFSGTDLGWPAQYVISNYSGANRHYIGLQNSDGGDVGDHNVYDFNLTTGALGSNTEWPFISLGTGNSSKHSLVYDGTNFWGANSQAFGDPFSKFTNWVWTTESAKYWVGYSWYDSAGTTHESPISPRRSITMKKRAQLTITTAPVPAGGGADDPNNVRIYMLPNATAPGSAAFKLQTTTTSTSTTLVTFNTGGAADGAGTAFPASVGGTITSGDGTSWVLHGDGTVSFTNLPATTLRASSTTDASLASTAHGLQVGATDGANVIMDDNEIMARNNGAAATLTFQQDGGAAVFGGGKTTLDASGNVSMTDGYLKMNEISAPAPPATNDARIYVDDNGSGKTRLRVRFATGAVQTIATEP